MHTGVDDVFWECWYEAVCVMVVDLSDEDTRVTQAGVVTASCELVARLEDGCFVGQTV